MKRIVGINSNCYHGYSIEEAIRGAAEAYGTFFHERALQSDG